MICVRVWGAGGGQRVYRNFDANARPIAADHDDNDSITMYHVELCDAHRTTTAVPCDRSELLRILGRIRMIEYGVIRIVLIILVALIWFLLIQLIESLTSTRKVPRVLCAQVRKLRRMNIELIWMAVRRHVIRYNVHRCHFMLLLPFHAAILKPDFDLPLGQTQGMGDFDAPSSGQVTIEMKFLL